MVQWVKALAAMSDALCSNAGTPHGRRELQVVLHFYLHSGMDTLPQHTHAQEEQM